MKNNKLFKELDEYYSNFFREESEVTKNLKEKYGNVFTYGTTPNETFLKLINSITMKPKRFIVVGCSIGWINFYWNILYPEIETIGIDIHTYRINFGNSLIKKYNLKNITLCDYSFYNFKFQQGDLIWESNLCFSNDEIYKMNNTIINNTPDVGIISYKNISNDFKKQKCISQHFYPVSWTGKQTFYIYENL